MNDMESLLGTVPTQLPAPFVGLDNRQLAFVRDYATREHPTRSAINAGYSKEAAAEITRMLLADPVIQHAIHYITEDRKLRLAITVENVQREYAKIAFYDPRNLVDDDGRPIPLQDLDAVTVAGVGSFDITETEVNGAITQRSYKYKLNNKTAALDALSGQLGLTSKRVELTGKDGAPLMSEMTENDKARRVAFLLASALRAKEQNQIEDA